MFGFSSVMMGGKSRPEFISASQAVDPDANVVVNRPAGIVAGDFLVAFFHVQTSTDSPSLPSGWTPVFTDFTANPRLLVCTKIAATEPGTYTFALASGTSYKNVSILAYRGAASISVGAIARASAVATVDAPSITGTGGTLILASFAQTPTLAITSFPAGMTNRVPATSAMPRVGVYDGPSPSGSTGIKTVTWAGSATLSAILAEVRS